MSELTFEEKMAELDKREARANWWGRRLGWVCLLWGTLSVGFNSSVFYVGGFGSISMLDAVLCFGWGILWVVVGLDLKNIGRDSV